MPFKAKRHPQLTRQAKEQKKEAEQREIQDIERRIQFEAPPLGTNPLASDLPKKGSKKTDNAEPSASTSSSSISASVGVVYTAVRHFEELPLSTRTRSALKENNFTRLTDIQRASIPHALAGRDILGAARTGSGKTLAFLIPMLELLWRRHWTKEDGLGGLIISPTRELALQIFDVLRTIGVNHSFSAGLVIGGKAVEEEQRRIHSMNILVCTPGRLLQHMDQTFGFDCSNLQMLVLDEADRILDMGFSSTINDILTNLPTPRQTLLFSATQTKSVRDLARLSLTSPQYLAVHEQDVLATPDRLDQHFVVVEAQHKFDLLFSFIKTHLRAKTLVFVSACKQVRFLYEMFRRVRPGVPLLHLHGKMSQAKRMALYYQFVEKSEIVMFATDIAARGLDFPDVDWVVQMDVPDSVETYIHRVGRTARYRAGGKALMFVCPSEQAIVDKVKEAKVDLKSTKVNPSQLKSISAAFQSFMVEDPELKFLGQKALLAYLKSVVLQSDKAVFNIQSLDVVAIAQAMGLPSAPKLSMRVGGKREKNQPYGLRELMEGKTKKDKKQDDRGMSDMDKLLHRKNSVVLSEARLRMVKDQQDESDDDEVLTIKRRADEVEQQKDDEEESEEKEEEKRKAMVDGRRLNVHGDDSEGKSSWLAQAVQSLAAEDVTDKARERERVQAKHQLRRMKEKRYNMRQHGQKEGGEEEDGEVTLGRPEEDYNGEDDGETQQQRDHEDEEVAEGDVGDSEGDSEHDEDEEENEITFRISENEEEMDRDVGGDERDQVKNTKGKRRASAEPTRQREQSKRRRAELTLEEQEALARKILEV